jgi:hypothetical protein
MLANPLNFRLHPDNQQQALAGSIDDLGFIRSVTVNKRTGRVVDGHLRVALAITRGARVPVSYVELTDDEEKLALLSFDWITQMAVYDQQMTDELLRSVNSDNEAIQAMLTQMAVDAGIVPPDNPLDEWQGMPEFDQQDTNARYQLTVYFETERDVADFSRIIGQPITKDTKTVYFPQQERRDGKAHRVINES